MEDASLSEEEKIKKLRSLVGISQQKSFSGPLPPPGVLAEYENIISDGAERIIQMAEKQSNHRIGMEKQIVTEELSHSRRGQWLGFILGVLGLGLATWLAYMGHDTVAGIFGTTTIVGLVAVFVVGKRDQHPGKNQSTET